MIAKRSIERVIETARVEEVVGHFVNLKRRGVNLIGLCPFHNEKTPSFTVSPSKNIYKCFGCGKGGYPVNFVMEHESYDYIEAIRFLASMYKIELEEIEVDGQQYQTELHSQSLFVVNEWAKKRFTRNLFETQAGVNIGLSYFKERGFREGVIKKFELGFAPDSQKDLTEAASKEQHNPEFLTELGLTTNSGYDFFRNRVMFTIHNLTGKAVGFAGRNMGEAQKMAKYINSPESEIYNKRKVLYGLYFAKTDIRKNDFCYLVEGYTDVISLHQAGIENVVASSGTSLTREQIFLLKRYTNNIKVLYDGDSAGINAALRGLELLVSEDMNVKLILLPENHDPDSFIKETGPAEFQKFIDHNEKDFVLFKTNLLLKDTKGDPIKKAAVLKDIIATLAIVRDPIVRSLYVKECSELTNVEEKTIVSEVNKLIKKEIKDKNIQKLREQSIESDMEIVLEDTDYQTSPQIITELNDEFQEKEVLKVLLTKGTKIFDENTGLLVVDYIIGEIMDTIDFFDNKFYAELFIDVNRHRQMGLLPDEEFFMNNKNENIRNFFIELSMAPYDYANWSGRGMELQTQLPPESNHRKEAEQAVLRLNYKKINKIIEHNQKTLADTSNDSEEYILLLKLHNKLLSNRRDMAKILTQVIN